MPMSQPRGPYKSQLFSTLNRQSQRLRDRLGTTVRQLKIAAEWGVQALIYPFYWLLHPQKWLGPVLGSGASAHQPVLPPSSSSENREDSATLTISDRPIQSVLATVQPWLLEPENSDVIATQTTVLTGDLNERIRESLTFPASDQNFSETAITPQRAALPGSVINLALAETAQDKPTLLGHWGQQLQSLFQPRSDSAIVIQGIASRCGAPRSGSLRDRRLVLTTQDNLSLDVLSADQQHTLNTLIRQELAQFRYQSRRQWALTQQQWRGLPLVNRQSQQVIAPLDWLWQGIYRWQARPDSPGQLISNAPPQLPQLPQLPQIQHWVEQTSTSLAHNPLIEATVVKCQQFSYQLIEAIPIAAFPPPLQHLGEELQQKLAQILVNKENLPETSPDPFELKVLIQAAIAHFFGSGSHNSLQSPSQDSPALNGDRNPQNLWLQWEELFAKLPKPPLTQPLLPINTPSEWAEEGINAADHWIRPTTPSQNISANQSLIPAPAQALNFQKNPSTSVVAIPQNPSLPTSTVTDPWDESILENFTTPISSPRSPRRLPSSKEMVRAAQPEELETAFDWIETQAKAVGYDKHILVWCLELLDRLAYWLEVGIGRIWQWLRQRFGHPQNSSLTK